MRSPSPASDAADGPSLPAHTEPIAAVATAPGRGAIGIVRLSGTDLSPLMDSLLGATELQPRRASLRQIHSADGELIDEALLLYFPAPDSYTGEDMLELHAHGNPLVLDRLMHRLGDLGARPAQAGEFSQRAFLNGRMDLAQAEAVADLIAASSDAAARAAARSLQGEFSRRIEQLVRGITDLRVQLEGQLDFPAEELELEPDDALLIRLRQVQAQLEQLLQGAGQSVVLAEGLSVALLGRPNTGKSSLLNRLAGEPLALVSDRPGTTRDIVRGRLRLGGLRADIADTAGLRPQTEDELEQQGMERALHTATAADIVLLVSEVGDESPTFPELARLPQDCRVLRICNKLDLAPDGWQPPAETLAVSAITGAGIDRLQQLIALTAGQKDGAESNFLARRRHLHQLQQTTGLLQEAASEIDGGHAELAAEQLRQAQQALGAITGAVTSEDLLDEIFASFCIGK